MYGHKLNKYMGILHPLGVVGRGSVVGENLNKIYFAGKGSITSKPRPSFSWYGDVTGRYSAHGKTPHELFIHNSSMNLFYIVFLETWEN